MIGSKNWIEIDTVNGILEIDGLKISLDMLRRLADPDEKVAYRFKRVGDNCVVHLVRSATYWPGCNPNIPRNCNYCGEMLLMENLYVDDGCPCNSARGVNFKPQPCELCKLDCCVKPGHRLYELFGVAE